LNLTASVSSKTRSKKGKKLGNKSVKISNKKSVAKAVGAVVFKKRDNAPLKLTVTTYVLDFGSVVINSEVK